jgi:hypothetical protein
LIFIEQEDGSVTEVLTLEDAGFAYEAGKCSVKNYVREVLYRVFYREATNGGHYEIDGITADFYLVHEIDLEAKYCDPNSVPLEKFLLTQRFGIEFVVARDDIDPSITKIAESGLIGRSGNPGYLAEHPVIVSSGLTAKESQTVNYEGFFVKGPSISGECLTKDES